MEPELNTKKGQIEGGNEITEKINKAFYLLFVTASIHQTKTSLHILGIKHVVSAFKRKAFYVLNACNCFLFKEFPCDG